MNRSEHLLSCIAEECAEVAQRISKALRFGLGEIQPGQLLTNAERISEELCDLNAVVWMAVNEGLIPSFSDYGIALKREKVEKFMAYAKQQGALQ